MPSMPFQQCCSNVNALYTQGGKFALMYVIRIPTNDNIYF